MPVFEIHPLHDARWGRFIQSQPCSSIFHTTEWLEALHRSYRFTPRVFTTSPDGAELVNGIVFCEVNSWLTGSRLVSLPFSDHCEPLVKSADDLAVLVSELRKRSARKFKYAEIRPRFANLSSAFEVIPNSEYFVHVLDLRKSLDELHAGFHKDSIQRKIRRSEREGVVLEQGRSDRLLQQFYELLLLTRRRHRIPPQPFRWFRNLVDCFGPSLTVRVASLDRRPIASILTLSHKQTLVYKYGCSDHNFHPAGGMPRLFWEAIKEAKSHEFEQFDLGRSELNHAGLIRFKDHLGATATKVQYSLLFSTGNPDLTRTFQTPLTQVILSRLPDSIFRLVGDLFYPHVG
jgi:hypothetical protein